MLGSRHDLFRAAGKVITLQAAHCRNSESRHKIRILSIGFLGPSPARVAGDVQHRRKDVMRAACPHLARYNTKHTPVQFRIPGARQPNRLGEAGGIMSHVSMQTFADPERRDAQPGLVAQEFLHGVQIGDRLACIAGAMVGVDVGDPILEMLSYKVK